MTSYVHHIQHWHCKPTQFIESYLFTISSVSQAEAAQVCTILFHLNSRKKRTETQVAILTVHRYVFLQMF